MQGSRMLLYPIAAVAKGEEEPRVKPMVAGVSNNGVMAGAAVRLVSKVHRHVLCYHRAFSPVCKQLVLNSEGCKIMRSGEGDVNIACAMWRNVVPGIRQGGPRLFWELAYRKKANPARK